eukprot:2853271-Rhodomonas_salina.2
MARGAQAKDSVHLAAGGAVGAAGRAAPQHHDGAEPEPALRGLGLRQDGAEGDRERCCGEFRGGRGGGQQTRNGEGVKEWAGCWRLTEWVGAGGWSSLAVCAEHQRWGLRVPKDERER